MRILRIRDVKAKTGLSDSQVYELIARSEFPMQLKLGPKAVGWVEAEIEAWIKDKMDARAHDAKSGRALQNAKFSA
jgi:prophage regulatory protein